MSKAEDLAKKYCEGSSFIDACMERPAYIAGYQQAEKDLELTWKDINTIIGLYNNLDEKILCNPERACKEILKQFKEEK